MDWCHLVPRAQDRARRREGTRAGSPPASAPAHGCCGSRTRCFSHIRVPAPRRGALTGRNGQRRGPSTAGKAIRKEPERKHWPIAAARLGAMDPVTWVGASPSFMQHQPQWEAQGEQPRFTSGCPVWRTTRTLRCWMATEPMGHALGTGSSHTMAPVLGSSTRMKPPWSPRVQLMAPQAQSTLEQGLFLSWILPHSAVPNFYSIPETSCSAFPPSSILFIFHYLLQSPHSRVERQESSWPRERHGTGRMPLAAPSGPNCPSTLCWTPATALGALIHHTADTGPCPCSQPPQLPGAGKRSQGPSQAPPPPPPPPATILLFLGTPGPGRCQWGPGN
ncbi:uncharacterized protein ACIB01_017920 [Guaruba guarouba]